MWPIHFLPLVYGVAMVVGLQYPYIVEPSCCKRDWLLGWKHCPSAQQAGGTQPIFSFATISRARFALSAAPGGRAFVHCKGSLRRLHEWHDRVRVAGNTASRRQLRGSLSHTICRNWSTRTKWLLQKSSHCRPCPGRPSHSSIPPTDLPSVPSTSSSALCPRSVRAVSGPYPP